jgi:hypothetical protein
MKESNDKKFFIQADGEIPFAQKVQGGYELFSNDRKMRFDLKKQSVFNSENNTSSSHFAVIGFVKDGTGWVRGNNPSVEYHIADFVKKINVSPYFTKAVAEYRLQLGITEDWNSTPRY